jgi:hypothetical protein
MPGRGRLARGKGHPRAGVDVGEVNGERLRLAFFSKQEVRNRLLVILKHKIEYMLEHCFFSFFLKKKASLYNNSSLEVALKVYLNELRLVVSCTTNWLKFANVSSSTPAEC